MTRVVTMSIESRMLERAEKVAADYRAASLNAIKALEDGRRGDALAILRAVSRKTIAAPCVSEGDGAA